MYRQTYVTQAEIEQLINESSDEDETATLIRDANKVDLVIFPPARVDELSDVEDIDEDQLILNDPSGFMSADVAGHIEVLCEFSDCNTKKPDRADDDNNDDDQDYNPSKRAKRDSKNDVTPSKWSKSKEVFFSRHPVDIEKEKVENLFKKYGNYSPIQLFDLFIDNEVIDWIVGCTNYYALSAMNDGSFSTNATEMRQFIGILFVTGYNTRPQTFNYWSMNPTLECPLVRATMPRSRFVRLKQNFHVCDNRKLDKNDKFSKITPLNNLLNRKFMQFGVFSHNLSIDEQMIAYYGRHSCKMFIKGKPIRFGFKYWDLCSADGYLFAFIPYGGASAVKDTDYSEYGLGETVVLKLLSKLENSLQHCVAFDNFFTSHRLVSRLSQLNYFCTGTIRDNRTNKAPLMDVKTMKKKDRGTLDYVFDKNNELLMARWNDNSVVTIASNHEAIEPMHRVKRWDKKEKKMTNIEMPQILKAYNGRMGGVDLFDNAINNYRIRVRGKKWYWPLITNAFDAAMVNAWKLHCVIRKYSDSLQQEGIDRSKSRVKPKKSSVMGQLEFRVYVTECLLRQSKLATAKISSVPQISSEVALNDIRNDRTDHGIVKAEKPRRCRVCHKHSSFKCSKCDVAVHTKCFNTFHNL